MCPCGKDNRDNKFAPFKGFTDKGYCHSCGETFFPNPCTSNFKPFTKNNLKKKRKLKNTSIPFELFEQSVKPSNFKAALMNSSLYKGLSNNKLADIPSEIIAEAMSRFLVGFTNFQFKFASPKKGYLSPEGANIFWLIDEENKIRGGQVVLFDELNITCPTVKHPGRHTRPVYLAIECSYRRKSEPIPDWLKEYKLEEGNKMPCLFGLPQLKIEPKDKPIAICEAPKTALIGWIYFPEYIWLSIGSKGMLKTHRLKSIIGRSITLFPDLSKDSETYNDWLKAAARIKKELGCQVHISRILEDAPDLTAQERKGADLADYLLTRCNWREFQKLKNSKFS